MTRRRTVDNQIPLDREGAAISRGQFLLAGASAGIALATLSGRIGKVRTVDAMRATNAGKHDPSVVMTWGNTCLNVIETTKMGPPMAARALAIMHTCMFDAWAAYDVKASGTRLGGYLRRPRQERTLANKSKATSYAAFRALQDLFPSALPTLNQTMAQLGYNPDDTSRDPSTAVGIGNLAALAVLAFRHGDGSNQLGDLAPGPYSDYTGYTPHNTPDSISAPNHWQPLRIPGPQGASTVQHYLGPHWGLVTPFALTSGAELRPSDGPYRFPSTAFTRQALQLVHYSANLTDRQKIIAEYWADSAGTVTPPGHWCLFAHAISARDNHDLDSDIKLCFALTNAVFDAGIAAWDAKRAYDSVRPITAIHYLFRDQTIRSWSGPGQGTGSMLGQAWQPYQPPTVVTPPFPEFVSGHSAFSAAAAEVLRRFTGSDRFGASHTSPSGSSIFEPGHTPTEPVTLSWATFSEAADQAGLSRRYGGIHFPRGDLAGRVLGRQAGRLAWSRAQAHIEGRIAAR